MAGTVLRRCLGKLQCPVSGPLLTGLRAVSTTQHLSKERCLNSVQLLGRVGGDPRVLEFEGRPPLVVFSMATNHYYQIRNDDGSVTEKTYVSWHPINVWKAPLQQHVLKNVTKGKRILVNGRLNSSNRLRNEGEKPRESIYIIAEDMVIFPSSSEQERVDLAEEPEMDFPEMRP